MILNAEEGLSGFGPGLAGSLRNLILSGQRFRDVLAQRLELGASDLVAIFHVDQDGPLTPHQLAEKMEMTSGTMTALLDRVEGAGFVVRRSNPEDRRSLLISTTPAGHHAARWADEHFEAVLHQALAQVQTLSADQLEQFLTVLGQTLHEYPDSDDSNLKPAS